jgi:hypothetical protein
MVHRFPELYFQALMRLVPREVNTSLRQDTTIDFTCRTVTDVKRDMESLGMSQRQIEQIENILLPVDEKKPVHNETVEVKK